MPDWAALDFRKLYVPFSVGFERLPYAVRCMAADIIRRADRRGRVVQGDTLDDELVARIAFHVRAHAGEETFIRTAVSALLADDPDPKKTYFVFQDSWLTIRNFSEAQRSTSAERMARHRGRAPQQASLPSLIVTSDKSSNGGASDGPANSDECDEEEKRREEKRTDMGVEAVRRVFDHWLKVLAPIQFTRTPALTDDRRAKIASRLKEFSPEDLCKAIDGVRLSKHHCGENDRGEVYVDFETIFRNAAKVEEHIGRADKASKPKKASPEATRDARIARAQGVRS